MLRVSQEVNAMANFDVVEASIPDLQAAMAAGQTTAARLVADYTRRITRLDRKGPQLNSVLELNPDAGAIAEGLDRERKTSGPRGPLHGIPLLLKDNIDTADALHTSAGSLVLKDSIAAADAFLVGRLRAAGAIILGKANMTEWANFMAVGMKNGYSSRGGQVKNPYGEKFDTGGSSSGSGVATAASLCAAAVGTETSGSILSPASNNSVVGIKPTVGLISRRGVIPISSTQDTAGPIARTVADAAILLGAMTGVDRKDAATLASKGRALSDYTGALVADGLAGARIGVPRKVFWERGPQPVRDVAVRALESLTAAGAKLVDPAEIANAQAAGELGYDVLLYEFKRDLNRYLRTLGPGARVRSLKELIRFDEAHPEEMLRYGHTLLLAAESAGGVGTAAYERQRSEDLRLAKTEGLDATFAKHRLDALVFPSAYGAAIGAKPGYPSITVPAGYTEGDGMPVGLTFLGPAWSEARLIRLAYGFEQVAKARRPPELG
jgi:amidase